MSDTWTALDNATTFDLMPELGADGNPVDSSQTKPDMESFDFSDVTTDDIDGGTLVVKAVYTPGTWLNNGGSFYSFKGPVKYSTLSTTITNTAAVYAIDFECRRVNSKGYGVSRGENPKVNMLLTQEGAKKSSNVSLDIENKDVFDVRLTPDRFVTSVGYKLIDTSGRNIITGVEISSENDLDSAKKPFYLVDDTYTGFKIQSTINKVTELVLDGKKASVTYIMITDIGLSKNASKFTAYTSRDVNATLRNNLEKFIKAAKADTGEEIPKLTYYQFQWAVLHTGTYLKADDAETQCKATYVWCQ